MSLLGNDRFTRSGITRPPEGAFTLRLPVLFFVSFALIALSRLDHSAVKELRAEAQAIVAPVLSAVLLPIDPARRLARQVRSSYHGFAEMERLRGENQQLKQWQFRAQMLERRVAALSELSKALPSQRIDYRTVRVIATSSGAFLHSALLEAGTEHGIKIGQPVINADGVLGRIVEAGRRTSRMLLLTDVNSRIPVLVGAAQIRAIVAGDNSSTLRLVLLPHGTSFDAGEEITTSGLGGMFPRGLRIGVVGTTLDGPRATLDASLGDLEYVSVLLYDNPGIALAQELRPNRTENGQGDQPVRQRINGERGARP